MLVDAAKEMRYEATNANLMLTQGKRDQSSLTLQALQNSRSQAESLIKVLLMGGHYSGVDVPAITDPELSGRLHDVRGQLIAYYDLLEDASAHLERKSDNQTDVNPYISAAIFEYEFLMDAMAAMESRLEKVLSTRLRNLRHLELGLLIATVVSTFIAGVLLWFFIQRLEQKNAQLSESETRSRLLLENAGDMVLLVEAENNRIVDANIEACRTLGYEKEAFGKSSLSLIDRAGVLRQFAADSSKNPDQSNHLVDVVFSKRNGEELPVEVNIGYLTIGRKLHWLGIVRDISDRKRMEAALHDAKRQAEATNRAKSEFLANISHEVRTPINGAMGVLQLISDTELDAEQREYVEMGLNSCRTLTNLMSHILDLSEIEAGIVRFYRECFSIRDLVSIVVSTHKDAAKGKSLLLESAVREELSDEFVGDKHRIQQILSSLVQNSIKFTDRGHIRIQVSMDCDTPDSLASDSIHFKKIRFEVIDTGKGISSEQLKTIFEPFQQGDGSCTRRHEGAGLGLTIVRKLVEQMDGRVEVQSEEGIGSVFTVLLPLEQSVSETLSNSEISKTEGTSVVVDQKDLESSPEKPTLLGILRKMGFKSFSQSVAFDDVERNESVILRNESKKTRLWIGNDAGCSR